MDEEGDDDVGEVVPETKRKENRMGQDPKTCKENSQGRDPNTPERNSQGEDPRTGEAPVKRWRVQKKRKEKKWKRKKKKKKTVKHRRSSWWTQRKEQISGFFVSERKEEDVEEKGRKRSKRPKAKQVLGKSGRWLFLLLILVQKWVCIDAAAGRLEPEGEAEVPEMIIVSDAVGGTKVDLGWQRPSRKADGKASEKVGTARTS